MLIRTANGDRLTLACGQRRIVPREEGRGEMLAKAAGLLAAGALIVVIPLGAAAQTTERGPFPS
jgi:hypothetical protein